MALRYNRVPQHPMAVHLLFAMLQVLYSAFRTTAVSKIQRLKFQFLRAKADGFTILMVKPPFFRRKLP